MVNKSPEQDLVDRFVDAVRSENCQELRLFGPPDNARCKSSNFADIEFTSASGCTWAIEAKSGIGRNRQNQIYQLFGNLLAVTKRGRCKVGLLISGEGECYMRRRIKDAFPREKFLEFGRLVPIDDVFVLDLSGNLRRLTWEELWGHE